MKLEYHKSTVMQVNALPSRCYYKIENNPALKLTKWKFAYFAEETGEEQTVSPTDTVITPSCWQMLGYGVKQYINIKYPFPYCPPYILKKNPCGVYVTDYILLEKQGKYYLNFDGVDSCYYVFINGEFLGYSTVSHSHTEFDMTSLLHAGKNEIRVIVFQYHCGSYLEDQDKFRMSGIFRDVYVLNRAEGHIRDYKIISDVVEGRGVISFQGDRECSLTLSRNGVVLEKKSGEKADFTVENPLLWSAEEPNLYDLVIECNGEVIVERVGIRKVEIDGNVFKLNGKPVKFRGVNRHSFTVNGFAESEWDMDNDLRLIKEMNANAVRTSHYPPHPYFIRRCDEEGVYVLEEADVECHGTTSQRNFKDWEKYVNELAESEIYREGFLHRVQRMYERDKNRTCVLVWSLGNESGWGENLINAAEWLHRVDNRPVHYEGAFSNATQSFQDNGVLDVYSRMYPEQKWIKEFVKSADKPLILCEYTHAMGNSCGDIADYWDILSAEPACCGAFVWEWCSHSIIEDGKVLYGGDHGEYPHDGNFCMDGIVTTDRRLNPEYFQVKEVYSPVNVVEESGCYYIENRNSFTTLAGVDCVCTVERDGKEIFRKDIDLKEIPPLSRKRVKITVPPISGYVTLNFIFCKKGNRIATRQILLNDAYEQAESDLMLDCALDIDDLKVNLYRPVTDNDAYIKEEWLDYGLDRAELFLTDGDEKEYVGKIVTDYLSPIGDIKIRITHTDAGVNVATSVALADHVKSLPRFGYRFALDPSFQKVTYFGRGEGEAYEDRKLSSPIGLYTAEADTMNYEYPKPQESGSHTDSRFVCLSDGKTGYMFDSKKNFSFRVTRYSTQNYKPHAHEMAMEDKLFVEVDYRMAGVGSASCGPRIDEKYLITERNFYFSFNLKKYEEGQDLFKIHRS